MISRLPKIGPAMAQAWVYRAQRRTVLHLREEIEAVLLRRALDRSAPCAPPDDTALAGNCELRNRRYRPGSSFRRY